MRSLIKIILFLFLFSGCSNQLAVPTTTMTIPAPSSTPYPTKTPIPMPTLTASATPIPEGTRIDVDTTKEGWISEFPGLDKYVQVGVDGVGTISFDNGVTSYGYDSKNTIFKFAAKDYIRVAGWEFKKNADGNFEYVDAIRIRAPRPNADGTVEDPANVLPHFNKEDNDLMNLFISETFPADQCRFSFTFSLLTVINI